MVGSQRGERGVGTKCTGANVDFHHVVLGCREEREASDFFSHLVLQLPLSRTLSLAPRALVDGAGGVSEDTVALIVPHPRASGQREIRIISSRVM